MKVLDWMLGLYWDLLALPEDAEADFGDVDEGSEG